MYPADKSHYPANWPKYLPYWYSIARSQGPVPNVNAVNWPQAQFAPRFLPPGSPSFQPYRYEDGPLKQFEPSMYVNEYGSLSGPDCGCGCGGSGQCAKKNGYLAQVPWYGWAGLAGAVILGWKFLK